MIKLTGMEGVQVCIPWLLLDMEGVQVCTPWLLLRSQMVELTEGAQVCAPWLLFQSQNDSAYTPGRSTSLYTMIAITKLK